MSESAKPPVITNPWAPLRRFTAARIALGRAGVSLPTQAQLEFQLAHASARDAVHLAFDADALAKTLDGAGLDTQVLHSAASDRHVYLQRPDLGRRLSQESRDALDGHKAERGVDLAFVVADGLSTLAIHRNAAAFLLPLIEKLRAEEWTIAPIAIVHQGRVAIGDEIGERLGARAVVVLIGERPGLSSPDSMGLYLTWAPRTGLTDAARNCISNVREGGLNYDEAAFKLHYLLTEARRRQLSGVALKDESAGAPRQLTSEHNFLTDD